MQQCWQHGRRILAELEGIADVEAARQLEGMKIWIPASEVALHEDEYLWADLTGCEVVDENGNMLGRVSGLQDYGAQDILIVQTDKNAPVQGEWMLPFIHEVILDVDLDAHRITVHLPEGMDACFTPRS